MICAALFGSSVRSVRRVSEAASIRTSNPCIAAYYVFQRQWRTPAAGALAAAIDIRHEQPGHCRPQRSLYNPWLILGVGTLSDGIGYALAAALLWRLAGTPDSGEALLVRKLLTIGARIVKRPTKQTS